MSKPDEIVPEAELKDNLADTPLDEALEGVREQVSGLIRAVGVLEGQSGAPVVQELVLARRHLEDARMRLGVGTAYAKGIDPWVNKVKADK